MSEQKKKRAGTRIEYEAQGQCVVDEKTLACSLHNISVSGIQISMEANIEPKQEISLMWEDESEGEIEGTFYIMRRFEKEEVPDRFFYGLRYYQLDHIGKQRVINILNRLKKKASPESEKISLESIYEVIDQGKYYIEKHLDYLDKIHPFFAKPLKNMQPYEVSAFKEDPDDPYNQVISDFACAYFHCVIMKNVVSFAMKKDSRIPDLLNRAKWLLEFIAETESKEEAIFEHIKDREDATDLRMQYNESTNRVFYGKQGMMEKIVKACEGKDLIPETQNTLAIITEQYDHTIELTNPNLGVEDIHTVSKHPPKKKEEEKTKDAKYNKEDSQYYVPDLETKGWGKKIVAGILVFLFVASTGYKIVTRKQDTNKYQSTLELPIPIKKATREGAQLMLYFKTDDWSTLKDPQIDEMRSYMKSYLAEEKWLRTALLRTDDEDIKMIVTTMQ